MHERETIHGDLKGVRPAFCNNPGLSPLSIIPIKANILIDHSGRARLADFGLLMIVSDPAHVTVASNSYTEGGTTRWMSPELLAPEQADRPTKSSDCYALGMVIYEVLSGRTPFHQLQNHIVVQRVIEGLRPGRPEGEEGVWFTDELWGMVERCWTPGPDNRPSINTVLECLGLRSSLPGTDTRG